MDSDSVVSQVQRRIELQSPEDLAYLVANVRNAAAARINEAFPHVDGHEGEDELRNQIEALVNEYINKTFALAAPNLTINGLAVSPDQFLSSASAPLEPEPVYEPFDTRKRRRVADLVTQEEKLLEEVAALKRSVPARAAADQAERIAAGLKRDQDAVEARVSRAAAATEPAGPAVELLERQAAVEQDFRKALEGLGKLKRDMPAVVAKMERAKAAGEYAITERR